MKNEYKVVGDIVEIYCHHKGSEHTVLISVEDFDLVNSTVKNTLRIHTGGYAFYCDRQVDIMLHNLIMNGQIPKNKTVDHDNRNKLDNTRDNLKIASYRGNAWNQDKLSATGERCIQLTKYNKYRVVVGIGASKTKHLGSFDTLEEAVRCRNTFLKEKGLYIELIGQD